MENHPPTRESLLRYLLHEIDEDEREQVDTLLICDEDYHAAFQEAEYDLLDALDAGELPSKDAERARRAFPGRIVTDSNLGPLLVPSPDPLLVPSSDPLLVPSSDKNKKESAPIAVSKVSSTWPFWIAAAAVVLVALAAGFRVLRMHHAQPLTQALGSVPFVIPAPSESQKPQLASPVAERPAEVPPPVAPRTAPLAVLLLPRASRSPHTLHLPIAHDASIVQIDWPSVSTGGRTDTYQLRVITDTGKVACTTSGIALRGVVPPVVRFLCPVRDVPSGMDFMRVTSLPADPDLPSLLEVTVSVERKPASAS